MEEYGWLTSAWITYLALHSILATDDLKRWVPLRPTTYRLLYSILSTVGLIALLVYGALLPAKNFFERSEWIRYVSLVLTTGGVIVLRQAFRQYRFKSFIGLSDEETSLTRSGILAKVRHPIYSGVILIVIGFFLFVPTPASLVATLTILIYLPIGMVLEEQKLVRLYGEAYQNYRKEVPALIPRLFRR